jgi:hypothetical protein
MHSTFTPESPGSVKHQLMEVGAQLLLEDVAAHYAGNEAVLPVVRAALDELLRVRWLAFVWVNEYVMLLV